MPGRSERETMRMWNYTDMVLDVKRIETCDILIALTIAEECCGSRSDSSKWAALHDKIAAQLAEHDKTLAAEDAAED